MFVSKAAVVGAGTMGGEIAQAIASSDIPVVLKDIDQKFVDHGLEKAREVTKGQLDRLVAKEKLTQEQADARLEEVMGLIEGTTSYDSFGDVDFVIEAAPEKMEIKEKVYAELDEVTPGHAILASNTSSLSISEMGDATLRPDKVVGFHFFYPASVMPLVEIIEGDETDPEVVQAAYNFAQAIKKQPITCGEVPGLRRQPDPQLGRRRDLARAGGAGAVDQEDRRGDHRRRTSPRWARSSSATCSASTRSSTSPSTCRSPTATPSTSTRGCRSWSPTASSARRPAASGFYEDGEPQLEGDAEPDGEALAELLKLKAVVESCLVLQEGVCTVRDIDLGMMAGAGMDPRRGIFPPFMGADMMGLDDVLEKLEAAAGGARRALRAADGAQAPGRPGPAGDEERPGLLCLPAGRRGRADRHGEARDPRRRRDRLAREPADERDLAAGDQGPGHGLGAGQVSGEIGAMVIASSIPVVFSAGADIKAFTQMDESGGEELIDSGHALLRDLGLQPGLDGRRGQLARLRRRLRAGDGVRLPDRRRVGRLRPAGDQARDHPRLRRHPAAAAPGRRPRRRWR